MKKIGLLLSLLACPWIAPCYGQSEQKPAEQKQTFDPRKVQQMLDEAETKRSSEKVSTREIYAIAVQLKRCWNAPAINNKVVAVDILIKLKPDGSLDGEPQFLTEAKDDLTRKFARSAAAAIALCQPFRLSEANYASWKELTVHFTTDDQARPGAKPATTKPEEKSGVKPSGMR